MATLILTHPDGLALALMDRRSVTNAPQAISRRLERAYAGYGANARKRRAWTSSNEGNRAAQAELMGAVRSIAREPLEGEGAVLDLGCGTGGWIRALSADVAAERIYGVDALASNVEVARVRTPRAHFIRADARALPFGDAKFSLVLLFTILLEMPTAEDVAAVLSECQRVLVPGGMILIYELRIPNPLNRNTRTVRRREMTLPMESRTLTLLPPLARRLGRSTGRLYPLLSAVPLLRSHRLWWYRKADAPGRSRA